jgi:hypothetical protein
MDTCMGLDRIHHAIREFIEDLAHEVSSPLANW